MSHNFTHEYRLARKALAEGKFRGEVAAVVKKLLSLVGKEGFNDAQVAVLTDFRKCLDGSAVPAMKVTFKGPNISTGERILELASASGKSSTLPVAAAIKLVLSTHFLAKKGSSGFWVVNVPRKYRDWPSLELAPIAKNEKALLSRLNNKQGYFTASRMKHIADGAQLARAQVQKALMVLADKKGKGAELVKRWFETQDTSAKDLDRIVGKLASGLKKIQSVLMSNRLIFTDCPFYRGDEMEDSEAFVFSGAWKDGMKVVYIEKGFFAKSGNVLSGRANWARVIVHELSHSELGTLDYPPDNSYGWQGINPKDDKFKSNKAVLNAENWAYFVVEAAAGLSDSERNEALRLP